MLTPKNSQRESDLDKELQFHLEQRIADLTAEGMDPFAARRKAMLEFDGLERVKEESRAIHWETVLDGFWRDLRYTLRSLRHDRRFTLLAILALALGIGAATVIFSAYYGVLLNTFAFENSDQVTTFFIVDQAHPANARPSLKLTELVYYRAHNHVFQDLSGEFGGFAQTPLRYTENGSTYQFDGCYLSANSFAFFGMKPLLGRLPNEEDVKPGRPPVFVIGAKLWRENFHDDPKIVGKTFVLNGVARQLVGIMPPRFRWAWVDAWLPFSLEPGEVETNPELKGQWAYTVGRLKPGITLEQAAADINLVAHQYARIEPRLYPPKFTVTAKMLSDQAVVGLGFSRLIYPLLGAVSLLLLIACANVANLLLARATVRAREVAVRAALGASRLRLLCQFLVESLCLAFAGCIAGCLFAYAGIKLLVPLIPYNAFPQEAVIELNVPVLLASLGMAVACTVICGMAPAIHALRVDVRSALTGTGTSTGTGAAHGKLRSGLVVAEVALSVMLLVGAGLMMRAFFRLQNTDLGFNTRNLLTASLSFPQNQNQSRQEQKQVFDRFFEKVKAVPGILAVSTTLSRPPNGRGASDVTVPGQVHSQNWSSALDLCSEDYLDVLQMHLQRGRFLSANDVSGARRVVVINQAFAEQYLANLDPIGRTVKFALFDRFPELKDATFEIIGVVSNVKNRGFQQPPAPQAYLPYTIAWSGNTTFIARTAVKPESLITSLRQLVWSVDPNVALTDASSLESWMQKYVFANAQFEFIMLTSFASIGLLLVLIGIFSVMAYTVALQTHEIGVRMALGAAREQIIGMVLRRGLLLIGGGMVLGAALSLALKQWVSHYLAGLAFADPWTYGGVFVLVVGAGMAACLAPAARAARVNPLEAIRHE